MTTTLQITEIDERVRAYDWSAVSDALDAHGWAMLERLLSPDDCSAARSGLWRRRPLSGATS